MDADSPEADMEIIRFHLDKLMEHFDAVQILATKHPEGSSDTETYKLGSGNWHSRVSMCQELVVEDDERTRHRIRGEQSE
jgi:hypothetical protein